ncbi:hypothetical protein [Streptomyces alfalfae]
MTIKRLTFESPYGCRWCGVQKHHHDRRWFAVIGVHSWIEPSQAAIKERMLRRRDARLAAEPPKYHARIGWAADHTGESADPYCADCKTDGCHPWHRIQDRLDRQRWGVPRRTRHSSPATGGWGGDEPW